MAGHLISGRLQQRSRYCAKEQQILQKNPRSIRIQLMVATMVNSMAWTVVAGWR